MGSFRRFHAVAHEGGSPLSNGLSGAGVISYVSIMATLSLSRLCPRGINVGLVCALSALTCACAAQVEEGEQSLSDSEQDVVFNDPEWDRITAFDADPTQHVIAGYGRASARTSLGCSGVLISDDVLLSSTTCRGIPPSPTAPTTLSAVFGRYGDAPTDFSRGIAEGRKRFETHFGITAAESRSAVPDGSLTRFTCSLVDSELTSLAGNGAAIDIWRCASNDFTLNTQPFGRPRTFRILPGQVWGHMNTAFNPIHAGKPLGQAVTATSDGRPAHFPGTTAVVLSPNGSFYGGSAPPEFGVTGADWRCGSEGGGIFSTSRAALFGIISGEKTPFWNPACSASPIPDDPITWQFGHNLGNYLGSLSALFEAESNFPSTDPINGSSIHLAAAVGPNSGSSRTVLCPTNFALAGFVSTSNSVTFENAMANFGGVCLPYERVRPLGITERPSSPQIDSAQVSVFGSTGLPVVRGADYNTYIHESLTAPSANATQKVVMCPPGSYVSGITLRSDTVLRSMPSIECSEVTEFFNPFSGTLTRNISSASKPGFGGFSGSLATSDCGPKSIAVGLLGRSNGVNATQARLYCVDL